MAVQPFTAPKGEPVCPISGEPAESCEHAELALTATCIDCGQPCRATSMCCPSCRAAADRRQIPHEVQLAAETRGELRRRLQRRFR